MTGLRPRSGLRAVALVVAGLLAVLAIGAALSIVLGDPAIPDHRAGLTMSDGQLAIVTCPGEGLSKVEIQRGAEDGPLVWAAASEGPSADSVLVERRPEGFMVSKADLPLQTKSTYAVRDILDAKGNPLITSYLVFEPSQISSGFVTFTNGARVSMSSGWCD